MVHSFFERFKNKNIIIVGDVMLDQYLVGDVNRISPEAPVPVVHIQQTDDRLGGAGNVALNVLALGASIHLCSVIGKDKEGEALEVLLQKKNIQTTGLLKTSTRPTTVKTRILARNQQLLRVDQEVTYDISQAEEQDLVSKFQYILDNHTVDAVILQDYNKGVLTPYIIKTLIHHCNKQNIPTIVDPKNTNFFAYKNTTLFKPNLKEVIEGTGLNVNPDDVNSLRKCASLLRSKMNVPYILITLSERGIYIDTAEGGQIIPTQPRHIADVCGAGDTVVSTVTLGLAAQLNIQEIATIANLAGGIVCESVGVVPIDVVKLEEEYSRLLNL